MPKLPLDMQVWQNLKTWENYSAKVCYLSKYDGYYRQEKKGRDATKFNFKELKYNLFLK